MKSKLADINRWMYSVRKVKEGLLFSTSNFLEANSLQILIRAQFEGSSFWALGNFGAMRIFASHLLRSCVRQAACDLQHVGH